MKLPLARVLPIVFALLLPSAALAQAPADAAPLGATAAAHGEHKSSARGHARTPKKPKAKAKSKRARTPGKAPKTKPGKKSTPKG